MYNEEAQPKKKKGLLPLEERMGLSAGSEQFRPPAPQPEVLMPSPAATLNNTQNGMVKDKIQERLKTRKGMNNAGPYNANAG